MEPRLGHPVRATQLTAADIATEADTSTVFPIVAQGQSMVCLFCRTSRNDPQALYLGKLAVAAAFHCR